MKTPPPDRPFDPDDPNFDPWADDPNAPKEPGLTDDDDIPYELPWTENADGEDDQDDEDEDADTPTPEPRMDAPVRGPAALLDSELRGEIEFEILFQQTKAELLRPPPAVSPAVSRQGFQLLAGAVVLVLLSLLWSTTWLVGVLTAVLLVHELGHFLAMRRFGFRDPRMFFVPYFGAALAGLPETTAVWKRALTCLMGPLPGLVAGAALYAACQPPAGSGFFQAIAWLVVLNTINLLPIVPMDGVRLIDVLFLSRRPWTGTVFRALAIGGLVALIFWAHTVEGKVLLALFAAVLALATPMFHRQARSRMALANHFPDLPENVADVPKDTLRQLFGLSLSLTQEGYEPARLAQVIRGLHAQAATRLASPPVAAAMLALYLIAWGLALGTIAPIVQAERDRIAVQNAPN